MVLVLSLLLGACGSDGGAASSAGGNPPQTNVRVGVDWFQGSKNCFAPLLAEARSCLAPAAKGVLSADRKRCDYGDGTVTDLVNPVPSLGLDNYVWNLTVTKNGTRCAHVEESGPQGTSNGAIDTFETASGKVTFGLSGRTDFTMTCPDGSSILIDAATLMRDAGSYWPGITSSLSPTEVTARESGDPVGGDARLLDCPLPP